MEFGEGKVLSFQERNAVCCCPSGGESFRCKLELLGLNIMPFPKKLDLGRSSKH